MHKPPPWLVDPYLEDEKIHWNVGRYRWPHTISLVRANRVSAEPRSAAPARPPLQVLLSAADWPRPDPRPSGTVPHRSRLCPSPALGRGRVAPHPTAPRRLHAPAATTTHSVKTARRAGRTEPQPAPPQFAARPPGGRGAPPRARPAGRGRPQQVGGRYVIARAHIRGRVVGGKSGRESGNAPSRARRSCLPTSVTARRIDRLTNFD